MIKYFCDKCGNEFKSNGLIIPIYARDRCGVKLIFAKDKHLCGKCANKFNAVKNLLEYEEDFFDMLDEDILIPTSDCLFIGFDNSSTDSACMTVARNNGKNIEAVSTFYGEYALKKYKNLIGME